MRLPANPLCQANCFLNRVPCEIRSIFRDGGSIREFLDGAERMFSSENPADFFDFMLVSRGDQDRAHANPKKFCWAGSCGRMHDSSSTLTLFTMRSTG